MSFVLSHNTLSLSPLPPLEHLPPLPIQLKDTKCLTFSFKISRLPNLAGGLTAVKVPIALFSL